MAHDIATNPQRLQVVDAELIARLDKLVGDAEVNLDQPLLAEDEWCELEASRPVS
jgi:antitoxin PrlF